MWLTTWEVASWGWAEGGEESKEAFPKNFKNSFLPFCTYTGSQLGGKEQRRKKVSKVFWLQLHNIWLAPSSSKRDAGSERAAAYPKMGEPPSPEAVYLCGCSQRKRQELWGGSLSLLRSPGGALQAASWIPGPPWKKVRGAECFETVNCFLAFYWFLGRDEKQSHQIALFKKLLEKCLQGGLWLPWHLVRPVFFKKARI